MIIRVQLTFIKYDFVISLTFKKALLIFGVQIRRSLLKANFF
jgi:hypothetical protein